MFQTQLSVDVFFMKLQHSGGRSVCADAAPHNTPQNTNCEQRSLASHHRFLISLILTGAHWRGALREHKNSICGTHAPPAAVTVGFVALLRFSLNCSFLSSSQLELVTSVSWRFSFLFSSFLGSVPWGSDCSADLTTSLSTNWIVLNGGIGIVSYFWRCQMTWRWRQPSLCSRDLQQQVKWHPSAPHRSCCSAILPAVMSTKPSSYCRC